MFEFKDYTLADINAIMDIVTQATFNGDDYSPVNADFLARAYLLYVTTDIVDAYMQKKEDGSVVITDINGLFKFVSEQEYEKYYEDSEKLCNMIESFFYEIQEKIAYIRDMRVYQRHTLTDVSMSELIDTINNVIEKFAENPVTSDDVKKLIESKNDIVSALIDKDRLDERLEEHEKRHQEREEKMRQIEKTLNKRSDKVE